MKNVIISIQDYLSLFLPGSIADRIVDDIMQWGCIDSLEFDLFDHLADYFPEHVARDLAKQAMTTF
jgi:hypothetical protein